MVRLLRSRGPRAVQGSAVTSPPARHSLGRCAMKLDFAMQPFQQILEYLLMEFNDLYMASSQSKNQSKQQGGYIDLYLSC